MRGMEFRHVWLLEANALMEPTLFQSLLTAWPIDTLF